MRLATAAMVATLLAATAFCNSDAHPASLIAQFQDFKKKFNRHYSSPEEELRRLSYFAANMKAAEKQRALNPLARFGVNDFADMSEEEFKGHHNGEAYFRSAIRKRKGQHIEEDLSLRAKMSQKVDWRTKGVVTPIKNQANCGGCWAFSTTGNIEGQWALAGNPLVSLSEQELISCDDTCNGCHGGNMDNAFDWLINARGGGITSEAQYPFTSGATGAVPACSMSGSTPVAFISSLVNVAHSESAMAAWVSANGPLSIAVDSTSFQTYQGGILTNCVDNQVDHAVLIVGYDMTSTPPYWIIKNQWGTIWGEEGYMYLEYGQNECLITTLPTSSVVSGNPPPVPPAGPPSPPAPPTPAGGNFTQYTCPDATCLDGCSGNTFPTGSCIQTTGGGSALANCGANNLHLQIYNSSDCSGAFNTNTIPLNTCSQDTSGNYVYDTCGSSSSNAVAAKEDVRSLRI